MRVCVCLFDGDCVAEEHSRTVKELTTAQVTAAHCSVRRCINPLFAQARLRDVESQLAKQSKVASGATFLKVCRVLPLSCSPVFR